MLYLSVAAGAITVHITAVVCAAWISFTVRVSTAQKSMVFCDTIYMER